MKKILAIILGIFTFSIIGQSQLVHTSTFEQWLSNMWKVTRKTTFEYDAKNHKISEMREHYHQVTSDLIFNSRFNFDNNANGLIQNQLNQVKQIGSEWVNSSRLIYTYTLGNIKPSSVTIQHWKESNWRNFSQEIYTYDKKNNLNNNINQRWEIDSLFWTNSQMVNYTYNSNSSLLEASNLRWDIFNKTWSLSNLISFKYQDANTLPIEALQKIWINGAWRNELKASYKYNSFDKISSLLVQAYDIQTNTWFNSGLTTSIYYPNESLHQVTQEGLLRPDLWINLNRTTYTYFPTTNTTNDFEQEVAIYPNPSNDVLNIKSSNEINCSFKIIDLIGRTILIQNSSTKTSTIDIKSLLPSTYFLIIEQNGKSTTHEFVKN